MEILIAERLRGLREETGRTQQEVVDELQELTGEIVSRQTVSKYENGSISPPYEMLVAFSRVIPCYH